MQFYEGPKAPVNKASFEKLFKFGTKKGSITQMCLDGTKGLSKIIKEVFSKAYTEFQEKRDLLVDFYSIK